MNKNSLITIISFTIKENFKKKGILVSTILIALVCLLVCPLIAYISLDKKEDNTIKNVYIYDASDFENVGYKSINTMDDSYNNMNIKVVNINDQEKAYSKKEFSNKIKECLKENKGESSVVVQIEHDDNISIDITIPKDSTIKESDASILGTYINQLLTLKKYENSAKNEGELLELMAGVNVTTNTLGKGKDNELLSMMKIMVPAIFSFLMYFMLIMYGQSMSNGMVTEKNSKIIELLVAHIKPRKLIIGKVLGQVIVAVGQIFIWIIALIIGIKCANVMAVNMSDKVFIDIDGIMNMIKKANIDSAFSLEAIIISALMLLMGFMFYLIFAAICGSFINKPDEAGSVFAIYTYSNMISFLVIYMGAFMEKKELLEVARYIPFTMPYSVPADVIIGKVSINQGLILMMIMLVCIVVTLYILGVVYERLVFNKLSLREMLRKS